MERSEIHCVYCEQTISAINRLGDKILKEYEIEGDLKLEQGIAKPGEWSAPLTPKLVARFIFKGRKK